MKSRQGGPLPRWVVLVLALGSLAALCCAAAGVVVVWQWGSLSSFSSLGSASVDTLTPEQIEKATALDLPSSASDIHSHYDSFQDFIIHVRFRIDPADLPALLGSSQISEPLRTSEPASYFGQSIGQGWWEPESVGQFQTGEASFQQAGLLPHYHALLIDTSDPASYTVYVVAFST